MREALLRRARRSALLASGASVVLAIAFTATASADEFVNDDGDGTGGCTTAPHPTIQAGVTAASAGETVVVCPGTYREQVEAIDKSVTIAGSGDEVTTLESPNSANLLSNWRGDSRRAILAVEDTTPATSPVNVDVSDIKVDGRDQGSCNPAQNFGIGYADAGGTVDSVTVDNVRQVGSGCQQGNGIYAINLDPTPRSITVQDSLVTDYQKNGITANGAGLTATIRGNEVQGEGAQNHIAQNGIQLFGSGGTVADNEVAGNECDHASCGDDVLTETMSGGILVIDVATGTEVDDNLIHDNDVGIFDVAINDEVTDPEKSASGNALEDNRYIGIYTDEGELTATGNEISGSDRGIAAVSWESGATDSVPVADITGNDVTGNDTGIEAMSSDPGTDPPDVNVAFNRILGNTDGVKNTSTATSVDAENNWFGSNAGPGGAVGAGVDATPFLVWSLAANPAAIQTGGAQSQVTASVATNSAGQTPAGNAFPATPVDVQTDLGSVNDTALANGSGQATLTSGPTAGTAHVTAALDGVGASVDVQITEPPADEPPPPDTPTGPTNAADDLVGTDTDDVIEGLAGDDTILGGLGDDLVRGGQGSDQVDGGVGDDLVGGGRGSDTVGGGDGNDVLFGGPGPDQLDGGPGEDEVHGNRGQDQITADDGEADRIDCGPNVDTVVADAEDAVNANCENVS